MSTPIEITVIADTNDGDYIHSINEISEEDLATIKPLIAAIKKHAGKRNRFGRYNWFTSEYGNQDTKTPRELYDFTEEVFQIFEEYVPYGTHGVHTIESITICPTQAKTKLL